VLLFEGVEHPKVRQINAHGIVSRSKGVVFDGIERITANSLRALGQATGEGSAILF
jgi:hypothetical protein